MVGGDDQKVPTSRVKLGSVLWWPMFKILCLIICLIPAISLSKNKIVGGEVPSSDHPGFYNTVALVKNEGSKVFCTGSIVSKRVILTAKHCLIDRELDQFFVFFGKDTNKIKEGHTRKPIRMKVRHPKDWEMTFPSFDVAWIELNEDIPKSFKVLPVLSHKDELPNLPAIHLAGHGNSSSENGKIVAGEKFFTTTGLKKYYDNARFFHILSLEGKEGQGACHGDSGGPAYIKKDGKWFIIGVTNGFDIVLTPKAMRRTTDEEFPYLVDCSVNQNLYSFAGAHGKWIEETSGIKIAKSKNFVRLDKVKETSHDSIESWCESRDFGSPRWNFLKLLLDKKVDSMNQMEAESFYSDCSQVSHYLSGLKSIRIDGEKAIEAHYSTAPLHLLEIDKLKISDFDGKFIDFGKGAPYKVKNLHLNMMKLENLDFFFNSNLYTDHLDVSLNPITTLRGLENRPGLKGFDLARTKVTNFKPLRILKGLEHLDISHTHFDDLTLLESPTVSSLVLGNNSIENLNFKKMPNLKFLSITSMDLTNINFIKDTPKLVELLIPNADVDSLDILRLFPLKDLEVLNITANPISDLSPLRNSLMLRKLKVFRTPLARGQVSKNETNCPTNGSEVLAQFCRKK